VLTLLHAARDDLLCHRRGAEGPGGRAKSLLRTLLRTRPRRSARTTCCRREPGCSISPRTPTSTASTSPWTHLPEGSTTASSSTIRRTSPSTLRLRSTPRSGATDAALLFVVQQRRRDGWIAGSDGGHPGPPRCLPRASTARPRPVWRGRSGHRALAAAMVCDSTPGANDGSCDACSITGGESTENEMFILIGSYFLAGPGGAAVTNGLQGGSEKPELDATGRSTWTGASSSAATCVQLDASGPCGDACRPRGTLTRVGRRFK
jgi:hypothetical protein